MANTKYWSCPHCDATTERLDVGDFFALGSSSPTVYCESCKKPIDAMKVMRGEYDQSAAEGCLQFMVGLIGFVIMAALFMWFMGAFG
jgi:hypothetical protein